MEKADFVRSRGERNMEYTNNCPECGEQLYIDSVCKEGIVYMCVNTHRSVFLEAA